MAIGEWEATDGKQRAVWIQPGGKLLVNGDQTDIAAILIESGSARLVLGILALPRNLSRPLCSCGLMAAGGGIALDLEEQHLCGMLFMSAIDTDLTTVPYKGTGPAMNDLLGGQVDFMSDQAFQEA